MNRNSPKIGVSLPMRWLTAGGKPYGDRDAFLDALCAHGVSSCELRALRPDTPPEAVTAAAALLSSHGLSFTIHGTARTAESAASDVLAPLAALLPTLTSPVTVTIHPVVGNNAAMLQSLTERIAQDSLPLRIALENNRLLPDKSDGDSARLVSDALALSGGNEPVGACFDFGHYFYYFSKFFPDSAPQPPHGDFLRRCIHTHIHAMENGRTHFPLDTGKLPLGRYLAALHDAGYTGVYNLEPEPERWQERDACAAVLASVDLLAAGCRALSGN